MVTLGVMAGVQVWARVGPARTQVISGPVAAAVLVLVGAAAGLSRAELGLTGELSRSAGHAAVSVGLVLVAYGVGVLHPVGRRALLDPRHRLPVRSAVFTALVVVPLATVVFEEVAFRGVLWGLIAREHGPWWATGVSSVLFGLWHLRSGADLARTHLEARTRRPSRTVLQAVLFTALTGVVLAGLRHAGGSLLAPVVLHWAANGVGVLASAWVWSTRRD